MIVRAALLLLVPAAPVLHYLLGLSAIWVFVAGVCGIAVLAEWIRVATINWPCIPARRSAGC